MSEWITDRLPKDEDAQITNEQELGGFQAGFEQWTPEFQAYFEQWLAWYVPRAIQYCLTKHVY